jgi:hypothetical protein
MHWMLVITKVRFGWLVQCLVVWTVFLTLFFTPLFFLSSSSSSSFIATNNNKKGALVFGKEDYQRPTQIRATLNAGPPTNPNYLRGGVRNPKPLPGCSGACCGQMTMLTNWCFPFWEELKLEGCEQLLHLPLIDVNLVPFDVSVVYKPGAGQAALMFMVRSLDSDGLINGLPLGDPILSPEQAFEFTCTLKHKTSSQGSGGNNEDSIGNSKE